MARPMAFSFWGWVALGVTTGVITSGIMAGVNYAIEQKKIEKQAEILGKIIDNGSNSTTASRRSRALARYYA